MRQIGLKTAEKASTNTLRAYAAGQVSHRRYLPTAARVFTLAFALPFAFQAALLPHHHQLL